MTKGLSQSDTIEVFCLFENISESNIGLDLDKVGSLKVNIPSRYFKFSSSSQLR